MSRCSALHPRRSEPDFPTCPCHAEPTSLFKLSKCLRSCSLYSKYSGVVYSSFISNDPPCRPPRSNSSIVFLRIPGLCMPSTKLPYAVRRKKPARNASARAFQQRFDLVLQKRQQRTEHDRQSAVDHRGDGRHAAGHHGADAEEPPAYA